jgi:hypothetical protein
MFRTVGAKVILAAGFLLAFAISASASPITYTWVGNNGFSGFFTIDTSDFVGSMTGFQVPDTDITAFSFSGDGITFDLADVGLGHSSGASIVFDTTLTPPKVTDGAGGDIADDPAGDRVSLFPGDVEVVLASGSFEDSTGSWVVESSRTAPEPSALVSARHRLAECCLHAASQVGLSFRVSSQLEKRCGGAEALDGDL